MSASRAPDGNAEARLRGMLDLDQAADDVAALHQQPVHLGVDTVDVGAQLGRARVAWVYSTWLMGQDAETL